MPEKKHSVSTKNKSNYLLFCGRKVVLLKDHNYK